MSDEVKLMIHLRRLICVIYVYWFQSFDESVFEEHPKADPKSVASVILGGGAGTRLFPLTSRRAKPAVRITAHTHTHICLSSLVAWYHVSFEVDNMSNS